ncbi:MAG TPA: phosphoribosylformylglycinamidine synthase subunit PurL [Myxococcaceae bacterium]|nr:phosphoribosylformylglycinamidine synthase subunit PurL [Myxococcaceae bacterium]
MALSKDVIAQHGLSESEYAHILEHLGREPNLLELGIFSVLWSEHCSYKSSRRYLRGFPTTGPRVLVGPGENAGVVDLGEGLAAAFKMESHNHPSYIEPYQGAATGVGGILRDVFTMGARPIASLNSLRFGDPSHPKTAWLLDGVVRGIGGYGNCIGVPTVGGEVAFDESYNGNCLVNAFTVGVLESNRIFKGTASGVGNPILYVGSKTGRDGIHGATMASAEFDEDSESKRPTVQVGDPFTEKLLLEACLELFQTDALVGIQDMGAAGLTSSSIEMAGRAGSGIEIDVAKVPRREEGMTPYEVMLSESQERMLIVAKRGREDEVLRIFHKWDLDAAVIGRVTDDGRVRILDGGKEVANLPVTPLTDGAPVYDRPTARPAGQDALQQFDPLSVPPGKDHGETLLALLARPTIASKEWLIRQYDHTVRLGAVVRPGPADAAVVRVERTKKGLALAVDCNARFVYLDPFEGARLAVAECARNVSCVGGEPLGLTDCLNFGNPERPEIMWQFAEATRGISAACRELGVPVVSGNVSLYNETEGRAILPTPTVAVVGLLPDVSATCTGVFHRAGDKVAVLGETLGQLGGSEWLLMTAGKIAGRPPVLDAAREKALQSMVRELVRSRKVTSAHDTSEGGLAVALAECCMASAEAPIGAQVSLPLGSVAPHAVLFGEDASRVIVSYAPEHEAEIAAASKAAGVPFTSIGSVGGDRLVISGLLDLPVARLSDAWRSGIPSLMKKPTHL